MDRRALFVALGLVLPAGIAAADTPDRNAPVATNPPTVYTRATAHRTLPNTVADVSLGISVEAHDAATVTRLLGERSQALMAYLREQGAEKLQTQDIDVSQETHTVRGGPDVVVGYTGRISVTFRTTPERMGALVSGALGHGANTLDRAAFAPADADVAALRRALATEATRMAFEQAKATAEATGEHVTQVRRIDVDPEGFAPPTSYDATARARFAATRAVPPIATAPGEQDISVTVALQAQIDK
jgi:uncharacterized protein YggE